MLTMATVFPAPTDRSTVTEYTLNGPVVQEDFGPNQYKITRVTVTELHPQFNDGTVAPVQAIVRGVKVKKDGTPVAGAATSYVYNQQFEDEFLAHHKGI